MGFNSAFKGLISILSLFLTSLCTSYFLFSFLFNLEFYYAERERGGDLYCCGVLRTKLWQRSKQGCFKMKVTVTSVMPYMTTVESSSSFESKDFIN